MPGKYDHLTHDELVRLLEARDRRDATRFGLVWEANEVERDKAINADFVALDLDTALGNEMKLAGKPSGTTLSAGNVIMTGIERTTGVCGGSARICRTRIPVWLLESLRRGGRTDAELLTAYPALTAQDLASAWHYARTHQGEIDREIAANGDDS